MAKGHRSQIKRERNEVERYQTIRKVILCKSVCSESMLRIRCHSVERTFRQHLAIVYLQSADTLPA